MQCEHKHCYELANKSSAVLLLVSCACRLMSRCKTRGPQLLPFMETMPTGRRVDEDFLTRIKLPYSHWQVLLCWFSASELNSLGPRDLQHVRVPEGCTGPLSRSPQMKPKFSKLRGQCKCQREQLIVEACRTTACNRGENDRMLSLPTQQCLTSEDILNVSVTYLWA